ncbi:unnamed protein product [Porites lobata]|uniref:Uncharacterized protein n=1 Tax=Porites lobata TaxID=104759 RepID=A0ABN8R7F6_9CNID|nr:unnamed protein product [Porites lobata]
MAGPEEEVDYYAVLNVRNELNHNELKAAYRVQTCVHVISYQDPAKMKCERLFSPAKILFSNCHQSSKIQMPSRKIPVELFSKKQKACEGMYFCWSECHKLVILLKEGLVKGPELNETLVLAWQLDKHTVRYVTCKGSLHSSMNATVVREQNKVEYSLPFR